MSNPRLLPTPRRRTCRPRPPIDIPTVPQIIWFHDKGFPAFSPLLRIADVCTQEDIPAIVTDAVSGKLGVEPTSAALVAGVDVPCTRASRDSGNSVSSPQAETMAFAQYPSFSRNAPGHLSLCVITPAPNTWIAYVKALGGKRGVRWRISRRNTSWVRMLARFHPDHVHRPIGAR